MTGGEGGIRTLETLRFTHFPGVRTRPAMRPLQMTRLIIVYKTIFFYMRLEKS